MQGNHDNQNVLVDIKESLLRIEGLLKENKK